MSVGSTGPLGSVAGSPLAQGHGNDVQRAQQDTADHARQAKLAEKASEAEGVGQTEEDEQASDRDADGRRPWELQRNGLDATETGHADDRSDDAPTSIDPTGTRGQNLDLTG